MCLEFLYAFAFADVGSPAEYVSEQMLFPNISSCSVLFCFYNNLHFCIYCVFEVLKRDLGGIEAIESIS